MASESEVWRDIGYNPPAMCEAVQPPQSSPRPARLPLSVRQTELLAGLALRFPPPFQDSEADATARLELLCEDLAGRFADDVIEQAIREGVLEWRFMPTAAEIAKHANAVIADRAERSRLSQPILPPPAPVVVDPAERERVRRQMEDLAKRLGRPIGNAVAKHREPQPWAPPKAETLMEELGLTREQANARIDQLVLCVLANGVPT